MLRIFFIKIKFGIDALVFEIVLKDLWMHTFYL